MPRHSTDFVARAHKFDDAAASRLSMLFAATFYDGVMLLKDAVEGSGGKMDGPTIAAWIKANARNHAGILGHLSPSATSHFLVGADALSAVYPDRIVAGGLNFAQGNMLVLASARSSRSMATRQPAPGCCGSPAR